MEIIILLGCLIVGVTMGNMRIEASSGNIDLSDAITAFLFICFGREIATVYNAIFWLLIQTINNLTFKSKRSLSKVVFNISMITVITYVTSTIVNGILNYISILYKPGLTNLIEFNDTVEILIIILLITIFVGISLLLNIIFFKLDYRISRGRRLKFDKYSVELLYLNFLLSSILGVTVYFVEQVSGMVGFILSLGLLLLCNYCIYMTQKLRIRNEAIKGLLKITADTVKYGDFRDKCITLIENLHKLIPYTLCALYTFDIESETVTYPIAYKGPKVIHIWDLGFLLSGTGKTVRVVKQGKIYLCKDVKKDKNIHVYGTIAEVCDAMAFAPILIQDRVVGLILIGGNVDLINFMSNGIDDMLGILSNQMSLAIENNGIYKDIEDKAYIDSLTGLYNRRVFDREISTLLVNNIPFSMVMYDIDNFKSVNDSHGHLAGDMVLKNVSAIIKKSIRKTDIPCRYGGEEIVVIFKDLSKEDAYIISDRIRKLIEDSYFEYKAANIKVTISGGVASYPDDGESKDDIIRTADRELYLRCKNQGKNKVSAFNLNIDS